MHVNPLDLIVPTKSKNDGQLRIFVVPHIVFPKEIRRTKTKDSFLSDFLVVKMWLRKTRIERNNAILIIFFFTWLQPINEAYNTHSCTGAYINNNNNNNHTAWRVAPELR